MIKTPRQIVEKTRKFILDNSADFENTLRNNIRKPKDYSGAIWFFDPIECPKGDISDFINKLKEMILGDHWYTFYRRLMLNEGTRVGIGFEMFPEEAGCVNDDVLRGFIVDYTDCDIAPLTSKINEINKDYIEDDEIMYMKFNDSMINSKLDDLLSFFGFDEAKTISELERVLKEDGNKKTQRFKDHTLESLYSTAKRKIEYGDNQDYRKTHSFRAEDLKISINHALAEMFLPSLEWKDIEGAY